MLVAVMRDYRPSPIPIHALFFNPLAVGMHAGDLGLIRGIPHFCGAPLLQAQLSPASAGHRCCRRSSVLPQRRRFLTDDPGHPFFRGRGFFTALPGRFPVA